MKLCRTSCLLMLPGFQQGIPQHQHCRDEAVPHQLSSPLPGFQQGITMPAMKLCRITCLACQLPARHYSAAMKLCRITCLHHCLASSKAFLTISTAAMKLCRTVVFAIAWLPARHASLSTAVDKLCRTLRHAFQQGLPASMPRQVVPHQLLQGISTAAMKLCRTSLLQIAWLPARLTHQTAADEAVLHHLSSPSPGFQQGIPQHQHCRDEAVPTTCRARLPARPSSARCRDEAVPHQLSSPLPGFQQHSSPACDEAV
ncbi:hypothetical protein V3C99_016993 [Haemonchus contortus]